LSWSDFENTQVGDCLPDGYGLIIYKEDTGDKIIYITAHHKLILNKNSIVNNRQLQVMNFDIITQTYTYQKKELVR